jgi:Domain of unknown function (DUF4466)
MKRKYFYFTLAGLLILLAACKDDNYLLPTPKNEFQNDCIKRTLGPNLASNTIEFAYAMALPQTLGSIVSAQVEASIPGAAGTFLEHQAYYTNSSGADVATQIANPSVLEGSLSKVTFTRDTFAVTLRYKYVIPETARGQQVSFKFSAIDTNGTTVSYSMGPYQVSNMDIVLDRIITDNAAMYISIADMAVYTAAGAAANPDKIDLVYLYRSIPTITFGHALVSPAADPAYLPGVTLPAGVTKSTKVSKIFNLVDRHLARAEVGLYIDDVDFQKLDVSTAPNYAINLRDRGGVWAETADGQYRAFIYVNVTSNTNKTMTISMKRLKMF